MTEHVNVGVHPEDLADGRVIAPGEKVENLDTKSPHNQRLVDDGVLVPVNAPEAAPEPRQRRQKEGDA